MPQAPLHNDESTVTGSTALQFDQLDGPQFEDALSGVLDDNYKLKSPPWLNSPKLKYYMRRSGLLRGPDTRVFFLVTTPPGTLPQDEEPRSKRCRDVVGALEIDFEWGDSSTVGIKYVTVHPDFCKQGLATRLYAMLISHLKSNALKLYRTRPGKETPPQFTDAVTRLLTENNIVWRSSQVA